jgi:hypothetical protein
MRASRATACFIVRATGCSTNWPTNARRHPQRAHGVSGHRAAAHPDDLGMSKLLLTAGEELLEINTNRYERASTMLTSNPPVEDGANCWAMRHP